MRNSEKIKAIGVRMREAREIAGLTQIKAAKELGYRNSSRLNKIECGTYSLNISVDIIVASAKLYDVSTDFLLLLSNDWERDAKLSQSRDIFNFLSETWASHHIRDINAIKELNNRVSVLSHSVQVYDEKIKDCNFAIKRFGELNPTFETEMLGGSRLLNAIHAAENAVFNAKALLRRFKADCKISGNSLQCEVFGGG
jgi:transcriptional regulator with XRE-family HTH domain